ncbi:MAG: hypothetical protein GXP26_15580 [Planctomycetes bacterium]|nr:hypothetical protein [Planctomycetota bacterium]
MHTIETNWEDEENNRQVSFSVAYSRQDDAIEITAVTPRQITFLCPDSNAPVRTIGVWTDKGRELLAGQLHKSGHLSTIEKQIEASLAV